MISTVAANLKVAAAYGAAEMVTDIFMESVDTIVRKEALANSSADAPKALTTGATDVVEDIMRDALVQLAAKNECPLEAEQLRSGVVQLKWSEKVDDVVLDDKFVVEHLQPDNTWQACLQHAALVCACTWTCRQGMFTTQSAVWMHTTL